MAAKKSGSLGVWIFLGIVVLALAQSHPLEVFVAAIIGAIVLYVSVGASINAETSMRNKVQAATDKHIQALARKRAQTLRADGYGNFIADRWFKEIDYFIDKVIVVELLPKEQAALHKHRKAVSLEIIEASAEKEQLRREAIAEYDDEVAPNDLELLCVSILQRSGWKAHRTGGSGDQGVDVLAEREGTRVVLQCKKYSSPVGNKAVQEAFAAMSHEKADHAIVVSNASYTRGAQELATTTGVMLIHVNDLLNLWEMLPNRSSPEDYLQPVS